MASSGITWPEPAPNWYKAKKVWKWGWELHVYGFASLHIVVGLYTIFNIFIQRNMYLKKKKLHAFFLNAMLLIFASARATVLFWDPYASEGSSRDLLLLCVILHGVALACVTSAFSVLLLILLDTTKLSLAPPRFQKLRFLIGVWASHVLYIVVSDVTVAFVISAKAMIFVCQMLYAIWGLVVSVGYAVAAYKIRKNLGSSRKTSQRNNNLSKESVKMHHLTILMCVASVGGFCLFIMSIYMAVSETGVFNKRRRVRIWPWFATQTLARFFELFMCAIIFIIALKSAPSVVGANADNALNSTSVQAQKDIAKLEEGEEIKKCEDSKL